MRAEELRIGNWVNHDPSEWSYRNDDGFTSNFQWNERDWYALSECTLNLDSIQPIPLTEEWLVKFGFKEGSEEGEVGNVFHSTVNHKISMEVALNIKSVFINNCLILKKKIDSVHELQNLYFALTGEELKFK